MLNKQAYKSTQKSQILRYKKSQHKKPVFRQISKIKIKIAETINIALFYFRNQTECHIFLSQNHFRVFTPNNSTLRQIQLRH